MRKSYLSPMKGQPIPSLFVAAPPERAAVLVVKECGALTRRRYKSLVFALLAAILVSSSYIGYAAAPKKVLVVTVTKGFRHSSIATAEKVLGELAHKSGLFTVDYVRTDSDMAEKMTPAALKDYDGVIFANTTGGKEQAGGDLPLPDKQAFLDW